MSNPYLLAHVSHFSGFCETTLSNTTQIHKCSVYFFMPVGLCLLLKASIKKNRGQMRIKGNKLWKNQIILMISVGAGCLPFWKWQRNRYPKLVGETEDWEEQIWFVLYLFKCSWIYSTVLECRSETGSFSEQASKDRSEMWHNLFMWICKTNTEVPITHSCCLEELFKPQMTIKGTARKIPNHI